MDYSQMDNEAFIDQLKQGSEVAYAHLLRQYHHVLFSYAVSLCGDGPSAQDIVQNVFFKTWEKRNKLKSHLSIKSFLLKLTYNEFINFYHRSKAASKLEIAYRDALEQVVEESDGELLRKKMVIVSKAVAKLPPKCKETFLLSKKEGLTNVEIAEYLNISLRTVEWHLTKAYNQLREEVTDKLNSIFFVLFNKNWKIIERVDR